MTGEATQTRATEVGTRRGKRAAGSDYTAASIQVLEGLEAVRRRPGMITTGRHHPNERSLGDADL